MPEFARGLKLQVTNRDAFESYIEENAHDPGVTMENWGHDSVPEAIFISRYRRDEDSPYYKGFDLHVNGNVSWNYWNEALLEEMLEEGILHNTGTYNVELVEEHESD